MFQFNVKGFPFLWECLKVDERCPPTICSARVTEISFLIVLYFRIHHGKQTSDTFGSKYGWPVSKRAPLTTLICQSCVLSFWRIKIALRLGKAMKGRLRSITSIPID